jgi:hypothetical protein
MLDMKDIAKEREAWLGIDGIWVETRVVQKK